MARLINNKAAMGRLYYLYRLSPIPTPALIRRVELTIPGA